MSDIIIYTTKLCPYCVAAKRLLAKKGARFEEVDVTFDPDGRARMTARANGSRTVPQIFFGDHHVGGCDELYALEYQGQLDGLLSPQATAAE